MNYNLQFFAPNIQTLHITLGSHVVSLASSPNLFTFSGDPSPDITTSGEYDTYDRDTTITITFDEGYTLDQLTFIPVDEGTGTITNITENSFDFITDYGGICGELTITAKQIALRPTADYLSQLITDRNTLADNLTQKGQPSTHNETFTELASKVLNIPTPTGTINITSNGTHNVTNYANASVNIPNQVEVTSMPTPTQELVGRVYKYTGTTTTDFENGAYYIVEEDDGGGTVMYNVSVNYYYQTVGNDYPQYSTDNGQTWNDITGANPLGSFSQIKFKSIAAGMANNIVSSAKLGMSIGRNQESPNYTLTEDIDDIYIFISDDPEP